MNRIVTALFWIAIITSLLLASWFAFHNTLHFHTDIARDFMLMEDMVVSKKLTFIGPRSGGIPGVFHGPAWLYLNLPIFILSKGNPVATAWFWVGLTGISISVIYFVTKKLCDTRTAFGATALYAFVVAESASNFINPFGATLLSPFSVYFLLQYRKTKKIRDLILALFTLGITIQFQMAWGMPILLLSLPLIFYEIARNKKIYHLLSFGILSLPLSTFILFDLRHQFLQLNSVIRYIMGTGPDNPHILLFPYLLSRAQGLLFSMFSFLTQENRALNSIFLFIFFILVMQFIRGKHKKNGTILSYILYFYGGFWIISLLFKGTMWAYYYWPFLPLFCIAISLLITTVLKKQTLFLFIILFFIITTLNIAKLSKQTNTTFTQSSGYWNFYRNQAESIYKDAKGRKFGWYVYSADQYGYSSKYAMHYMQKRYPQTKGYAFQKKQLTYLVIFPSTNKYTSEGWWKENQIKINKKPIDITKYRGGSYTEKYLLTPEDQSIPSDPNLIQDLLFR